MIQQPSERYNSFPNDLVPTNYIKQTYPIEQSDNAKMIKFNNMLNNMLYTDEVKNNNIQSVSSLNSIFNGQNRLQRYPTEIVPQNDEIQKQQIKDSTPKEQFIQFYPHPVVQPVWHNNIILVIVVLMLLFIFFRVIVIQGELNYLMRDIAASLNK
jgi:hypothetical protein